MPSSSLLKNPRHSENTPAHTSDPDSRLYRKAAGREAKFSYMGHVTMENRHECYGLSQSCRAMIECIFGWGKQHGTMRKTKHRGIRHAATDFMHNLIAYKLIRIPKLVTA